MTSGGAIIYNIFKIIAFIWFFGLILEEPISLGHANLDFATMKPRREASNVKTSDIDLQPCGTTAGDKPTTDPSKRMRLKAGQEFEVKWEESINHRSKYRIAFAKDNSDVFDTVLMDLDDFDNDELLPPQKGQVNSSDWQDKDGGHYTYIIKIPDIECEECALQLLQKMYDTGTLSNTIYTSCMDIIIEKDNGNTPPPPTNDRPSKPTGLKVKLK